MAVFLHPQPKQGRQLIRSPRIFYSSSYQNVGSSVLPVGSGETQQDDGCMGTIPLCENGMPLRPPGGALFESVGAPLICSPENEGEAISEPHGLWNIECTLTDQAHDSPPEIQSCLEQNRTVTETDHNRSHSRTYARSPSASNGNQGPQPNDVLGLDASLTNSIGRTVESLLETPLLRESESIQKQSRSTTPAHTSRSEGVQVETDATVESDDTILHPLSIQAWDLSDHVQGLTGSEYTQTKELFGNIAYASILPDPVCEKKATPSPVAYSMVSHQSLDSVFSDENRYSPTTIDDLSATFCGYMVEFYENSGASVSNVSPNIFFSSGLPEQDQVEESVGNCSKTEYDDGKRIFDIKSHSTVDNPSETVIMQPYSTATYSDSRQSSNSIESANSFVLGEQPDDGEETYYPPSNENWDEPYATYSQLATGCTSTTHRKYAHRTILIAPEYDVDAPRYCKLRRTMSPPPQNSVTSRRKARTGPKRDVTQQRSRTGEEKTQIVGTRELRTVACPESRTVEFRDEIDEMSLQLQTKQNGEKKGAIDSSSKPIADRLTRQGGNSTLRSRATLKEVPIDPYSRRSVRDYSYEDFLKDHSQQQTEWNEWSLANSDLQRSLPSLTLGHPPTLLPSSLLTSHSRSVSTSTDSNSPASSGSGSDSSGFTGETIGETITNNPSVEEEGRDVRRWAWYGPCYTSRQTAPTLIPVQPTCRGREHHTDTLPALSCYHSGRPSILQLHPLFDRSNASLQSSSGSNRVGFPGSRRIIRVESKLQQSSDYMPQFCCFQNEITSSTQSVILYPQLGHYKFVLENLDPDEIQSTREALRTVICGNCSKLSQPFGSGESCEVTTAGTPHSPDPWQNIKLLHQVAKSANAPMNQNYSPVYVIKDIFNAYHPSAHIKHSLLSTLPPGFLYIHQFFWRLSISLPEVKEGHILVIPFSVVSSRLGTMITLALYFYEANIWKEDGRIREEMRRVQGDDLFFPLTSDKNDQGATHSSNWWADFKHSVTQLCSSEERKSVMKSILEPQNVTDCVPPRDECEMGERPELLPLLMPPLVVCPDYERSRSQSHKKFSGNIGNFMKFLYRSKSESPIKEAVLCDRPSQFLYQPLHSFPCLMKPISQRDVRTRRGPRWKQKHEGEGSSPVLSILQQSETDIVPYESATDLSVPWQAPLLSSDVPRSPLTSQETQLWPNQKNSKKSDEVQMSRLDSNGAYLSQAEAALLILITGYSNTQLRDWMANHRKRVSPKITDTPTLQKKHKKSAKV